MGLVEGHAYTIVYHFLFRLKHSINPENFYKWGTPGARRSGLGGALTATNNFGILFRVQIRKDWGIMRKMTGFSSFFGKTFCNISKSSTSARSMTRPTTTIRNLPTPRMFQSSQRWSSGEDMWPSRLLNRTREQHSLKTKNMRQWWW